jgi:hypothetical protein
MSIEWLEADPSVISTAQEIIQKYHPDLMEALIGFVFRSEAGKSLNKFIVAKACKVDRKLRPFLDDDYHFFIWIDQETWERISTEQRQALIDHELCHCTMLDMEPKFRAHDIEEFRVILDRWGLWNYDLVSSQKELLKASRQLTLPLDESPRVSALSPERIPAGL